MSERGKFFTDLGSIRGLRSWAEGVKAGQVITIMPIAMNVTLDLLDFIEKQQAVVEAARALMDGKLILIDDGSGDKTCPVCGHYVYWLGGKTDKHEDNCPVKALADALAEVGRGE